MKIKLNILDKEKFNRFLFNYKKNKISDKILYFIYQYNANKNSFISKYQTKVLEIIVNFINLKISNN